MLDAGCALLSRQFDRDREAVLRRAVDGGCAALLVHSVDVDRQRDAAALAHSWPGRVYAAVGALPDNVKRTNEKQLSEWVETARELALTVPEVVALQAGLNLALPVATHHAQEALLRAMAALSVAVRLPLLLHAPPGSLGRALELLGAEPLRIALAAAGAHADGPAEPLDALLARDGARLLFGGAGVSDGSPPATAVSVAVLSSRAASLLASGSPGGTPQTLPDEYLRTQKNEPSNLGQIASDLAAARRDDVAQLRADAWATSLDFFGIADGAAAAATSSSGLPEEADSAKSEEEAIQPSAAHAPTRRAVRPAAPPPPAPRAAAELAVAHFACRRCRRALFAATLPLTHSAGGGRAAAGDDNVCLAHCFLPLRAPQDCPPMTLAEAEAGDAATAGAEQRLSCAHCSAKLGRFCSDGAACACGARVEGALAKLYASRLDFVGVEDAMQALQLRGEREAAEEVVEEDGRARGSRAKAPKPKRDNLRNLSSFRNKG